MERSPHCPSCNQEVPPGLAACPRDGTPIPRDPLIGTTVGEYEIVGKLGSGGMGVVFQGFQPIIHKQVALKVLNETFAHDPAAAKRFIEEARAVNAVHHRGIVDVFGFGQLADGRQYLVMELLDGTPLDTLMEQKGAMLAADALPILIDVAEALAAAHAADVIHRDMKPSNVFVVQASGGARYAKLLDFGLAKQSAPKPTGAAASHSGMIVGTPEYIAPEQALGERVTAKADLYALGVMAFEMLSGALPFTGENVVALLNAHVNSPVPRLKEHEPSVPAGLDEIVFQLMQKRPDDRPSSATQVGRELARLRRELHEGATRVRTSAPNAPAAAPPVSPSERVTRVAPSGAKATPASEPESARQTIVAPALTKRRQGVVWGAAALAVLAIAGWALSALTRRGAPPPAAAPAAPAAPAPEAARAPLPPPSAPVAPLAEPPSVAAAPTAPATQAPPSGRAAPHPAPRAVTQDALFARIRRLETELTVKQSHGAQVSPVARHLLDSAMDDAHAATNARAREDVASTLDDWERKFGR